MPSQRSASKDTEPNLHLIEPASIGWGVTEMDILVAGQPAIIFGVMSSHAVQDYLDFLIRVMDDEVFHKIEKFSRASEIILPGLDVADSNV